MVRAIALHVSVPVLDLPAAEKLYREGFGARVTSRDEGVAILDVAGQRLALRQVSEDSGSLQRGARRGLRARHFGFAVSTCAEVDSAAATLVSMGLDLVVEPQDRTDGRSAIFCDESGNQIEVFCQEGTDG